MDTKQIVSILRDFANELDNNVSVDSSLAQIAMEMMTVQESLLPIQREALQRFIIQKTN